MRFIAITVLVGFALFGCGKSEITSSSTTQNTVVATQPTASIGNTQTIVGEVSFGTQMGGITLENGKYYDMMSDSEMANKIQSNCSNGDICEVVGVIEKDQLISVSSVKLVKNEVVQPSADNSVNESSTKQMQPGVNYMYFRDGSCTENCLSQAEAETVCKSTKSLSRGTISSLAILESGKNKVLLEGGKVEDFSVTWNNGRCGAYLVMSGMYEGNSARASFSGSASRFTLTDDKNILVTYIDTFK
jgi:hypothetical protein